MHTETSNQDAKVDMEPMIQQIKVNKSLLQNNHIHLIAHLLANKHMVVQLGKSVLRFKECQSSSTKSVVNPMNS